MSGDLTHSQLVLLGRIEQSSAELIRAIKKKSFLSTLHSSTNGSEDANLRLIHEFIDTIPEDGRYPKGWTFEKKLGFLVDIVDGASLNIDISNIKSLRDYAVALDAARSAHDNSSQSVFDSIESLYRMRRAHNQFASKLNGVEAGL